MLKTIRQKSWKVALAAAVGLIVVGAGSAQAVVLAPGGGPTNITGSATNSGNPQVASLISFYNDPLGFSGTLTTIVVNEGVLNPLGGLTFFYNIDNDINNRPLIDQEIDFAQFDGFSTSPVVNADYSTTPPLNGGTAFPTDVSRSNLVPDLGNSVVFGYNNPADPISAGDVSAWMFVRTSSLTFLTSNAVLTGFGTANAAILAPVPEPTTVLFGLGLLGVVGFGRRRS